MYLRTYAELVTDMQTMARDTTPARWTAAETRRCFSRAVENWADRVSFDAIYTIPGGLTSGVYEYVLPAYITGHIQPQVQYHMTDVEPSTDLSWTDIRRFNVYPNTSGGRTLHLLDELDSVASTSDARIVYRARNSPAPTTDPTLSVQCLAADTTATVGAAVLVADTGWVKMEAEWIQYAGVTRTASTTTLNNLVRGQWGTTAATHAATTTTVYWGVCVPTPNLLAQLYDQTLSYLHELFLTDASPKEQETHERMMLFYEQRANSYWRRHTPRTTTFVIAERMQ